ncbi:YeiH family protein [Natronosalvus rutilus]|uniref:Sulfate exporter family transporter n=1 Tax=Natronosalvus rutilus TaxID=2953753 RepID=A0A9E7SY86_9EURY|nr:putative sulfate exporter family transporter [Natronosalvus rutilus]UTF54808.1 putative sulfate exporter family transporter [Natronosalvus rutilus]
MISIWTRYLPGILLLVGLALVARVVSLVVPANQLVGAIVLGALVGNVVGTPPRFDPGIQSYNHWLKIGIVLLGAQLIIGDLFATGPLVVLLVLGVLIVVLVVTELVGRNRGVNPRMRSLLGAGIGICGISAVVAVAEGIRARQEEIAYAVTTILVFDAVTLVLYPLVGTILNLEPVTFGIWAGLTMFSTGPVAAAGFAHSGDAGTWAVLTKLVRNSLLGVIVIWFSLRFSGRDLEKENYGLQVWQSLPKFVIGFFLLAALASAGVFSAPLLSWFDRASQWAFLIAFVGLGFDLRLTRMRAASLTPMLVTSVVFVTVSLLTLALLLVIL